MFFVRLLIAPERTRNYRDVKINYTIINNIRCIEWELKIEFTKISCLKNLSFVYNWLYDYINDYTNEFHK